MNGLIKEIIDDNLIIVSSDGKEIKYTKLFSFDSNNGNSYIVYTDNKKNKSGKINAYASIYDPNGEDLKLYPVETEAEWKIIENVFSAIENELIKGGIENEEEN